MLISILKFLILCYDRLYESHKVFVSFYELWGIMKQKEYYTAGELARLFNIPKQTMLYYDKTGVLQPEFIAENGYRYYATPQYLTLEIILFLRKMDISVPDIRNFLQHKSREEILKVIAKRENECRQQIQEAEMLMHSLGNYREALEKSRSLPLNQVLPESCSDCRMYLTPIPKSQRGGLSAITIRARHVREAFSHCYCKEKPTGWVISRDDFFHSRFSHSSAVVTKSGPPSSSLPCNYIRPAGLYTSIHIKGAYFHHGQDSLERMQDFMDKNNLVPDGDVFLFPIISYWVTNNPEEYINSLSVKVVPAGSK